MAHDKPVEGTRQYGLQAFFTGSSSQHPGCQTLQPRGRRAAAGGKARDGASSVGQVHVGAALEQRFSSGNTRRGLRVEARVVQRSAESMIPRIGIGAARDQQINEAGTR